MCFCFCLQSYRQLLLFHHPYLSFSSASSPFPFLADFASDTIPCLSLFLPFLSIPFVLVIHNPCFLLLLQSLHYFPYHSYSSVSSPFFPFSRIFDYFAHHSHLFPFSLPFLCSSQHLPFLYFFFPFLLYSSSSLACPTLPLPFLSLLIIHFPLPSHCHLLPSPFFLPSLPLLCSSFQTFAKYTAAGFQVNTTTPHQPSFILASIFFFIPSPLLFSSPFQFLNK